MHHEDVQCDQTSYFVFERRHLLRKQRRNVLFVRHQDGRFHLSNKERTTRRIHGTPSIADILEKRRAQEAVTVFIPF